jgi:hypothetical protein
MNQTSHTFADLIFSRGISPVDLIWIAILSATVGMISHWMKINYKDKLDVSILQYFFVQNLQATIVAFGTMLASLVTVFAPLDYDHITVYQVVSQAFGIGYACDSIFNNSQDK